LTTAAGIEGAFGAFIAENEGNYKNITAIASIFLDNETTATQRQIDTSRIYRDDGLYPVLDPTTSGYGIDINWQNVVYVVSTGGSALTPTEKSQLANAAADSATAVVQNTEIKGTGFDTANDSLVEIRANQGGGGSCPTAVEIREEIDANSVKLDVAVSTRLAEASINTTGGAIDNVILVNTTTTNSDMRGTDGANTIAPDNVGIAQIQVDIDSLNDFNPDAAVVESGETWTQSMRLVRANAAGSIVDDDVSSGVIKSADGTKDRIEFSYIDGSRTITGTDVT
jgi:hypothetical protein